MISENEQNLYSRQIMMFGEEGQEKLKNSSVTITGSGGLGSPIAIYLAAAGVGKIRIIDHDTVALSNLNRQILHHHKDIGVLKVDSAKGKLNDLNPNIDIETFNETLSPDNIKNLIGKSHIVVDALDNYHTRFSLNEAAVQEQIPLVHGAVEGFHGQVTTIIPGETPCMRCFISKTPPKKTFPILGTTAGIIGTMQANEVIKYLTGSGKLLTGRLLLWDGFNSKTEEVPVNKNQYCEICATE
ncbi:UBA/THIF-type NAD/FAD binding protein [Methanohalobium evestigatum Z-7303]|uniref:UBA/THIF-type NAD/FAD binding protein n=1 Tax=Methanohalobium evestigatum (strain ATCC BAA-1072 / DSM 3721 / NBRC 107634 / OCM 161 / Z-7303) TaxID=644295 RepID=D7E7C8_METEZ|nr:HesA/MoeB/ThiF family protein [Methanohalobium evestigatum]ADI73877.1 UBA/THIF-type NAD/FAD binding protein [Methanohalobium evestigatum Z-7303]